MNLTTQLPLPFIAQLDADIAEREHVLEIKRRVQHQLSWLKGMFERYPPTPEEYEIMLGGIRLARFVGGWECEKCQYGPTDHTLHWLFNTKICLKDAYKHGYSEAWNEFD